MFAFRINLKLADIKTNAVAKTGIRASAHLYQLQRCDFFFPHPVLWFNLVRKTEEQLVWCQFRRPLSLLFIPLTPPDVFLLVLPGFSFKPAI